MVTPSFPPRIDGISNHVFFLTKNLAEFTNSISIITPQHDKTEETKYNHLKKVYRVKAFFLPGWPYPTLKSASIPLGLGSKIESIIRNGNFDIVHAHGHHYPFSWYALKSAKKFGIPSILTLHGMYALNPNVMNGKTKIEEIFNKYFFTKLLSQTNVVIGLTDQLTNYARNYSNQYLKYFTIPNGVDTELFKSNLKNRKEYRKHYDINEKSLVILFRGRFEQVKGIIEFAKAAKNIIKNARIEIIIVGGGTLEDQLKKIVSNNNRIHIFEWQPEEKIHELYIVSDIFVLPSRFEALPITIIEAMNAGLHIVYSPVGGLPEILEKYPRKTKINEVSEKNLENILTKVISNFENEYLQQSLDYASRFDWKNIAYETAKIYPKILEPSDKNIK